MSDIYRAKQPFMFQGTDGAPRHISVGDLISSDDPGFKGREALFEKVEVQVSRQDERRSGHSETTTDAPGEKRSVGSNPASRTAPPAQSAPPTQVSTDKSGDKSSLTTQKSGPARGSGNAGSK